MDMTSIEKRHFVKTVKAILRKHEQEISILMKKIEQLENQQQTTEIVGCNAKEGE